MTYPNKVLTEVCELLLDEDLTPEQIANLAADIPGECEAISDNRNEAAWEALQERGAPDNSAYRRDMFAAGRGHLLGDWTSFEGQLPSASKPIYWVGSDPVKCDICKMAFGDTMFDSNTVHGWANVCKTCFHFYGQGLGTGRGQKYEKQADGRWMKVEG